MRSFPLAVAVALFTLFLQTSAQADWTVYNNLKERFTITYWSQSQPKTVWKVTIDPGKTAQLKLGMDKHLVELRSGGGNVYKFRPTTLEGRETDMKDILTPDGKANGRIKYKYMNQEGFYQLKKSK